MNHTYPFCLALIFFSLLGLGNLVFAQDFRLLGNSGLIRDEGGSFSASWGDFDNDGCIDIFIVNGNWPESNEANLLYRNNCDGTFTWYNHPLFALDRFKSTNAAWGDFDQDGWLDLMVGNAGNQSINVYHNDQKGGFDQVINDPILNTRGNHKAYWVDLNNDGWLDIYLANEDGPDKLLLHSGSRDWRNCFNVALVPFQNHKRSSRSMAFGDIDNDGDLDVFQASKSSNCLYINEGNGTFRFDANSVVSQDDRYCSNSLFADLDNDGDLDLLVATDKYPNNTLLYENLGDGQFVQRIEGALPSDRPNAYGMAAKDFDNDGDLDIFLSCSFGRAGRPNAYYENRGNWDFRFRDLGLITRGKFATSGLACEDFDNDGDIDIFLSNLDRSEPNFFFQNNTVGKHWINVHLTDDLDSLSSWGAKVYAKAKIGAISTWQYRNLNPVSSYGQSSLDLSFGLGAAEMVDSLLVIWPSGDTCVFADLVADQFLTVLKSCINEQKQKEPQSELIQALLDANLPSKDTAGLVAVEEKKVENPIILPPKPKLVVIRDPKPQQLLEVSQRKVRLYIWDDDLVDGDIVSIKLAGEMIARRQAVQKAKSLFNLNLTQNEAVLEIVAENEGKIPPNTAVIMIDDGRQKRKIYMKTQQGQSGTFRLKLRP